MTVPGCCGIKSVVLSRRGDGSVSITATGLKADVDTFLNSQLSSGTVTSTQKKQHIYTITKTDNLSSDTYHRIDKAGIFKSVPQPIYDLYQSEMMHKSLVPPTYDPDASIFIRPTDDIYGATGWTVSDILDELDLNVRIPSAFNYHVYEFNVRKGMPIVSLLQNLFPFPGLVIHNYNGYYYVGFPGEIPGPNSISDAICEHSASSTTTVTYEHSILGAQGEPKYVYGLDGQELNCGSEITFNLIGSVFGVTSTTYSSENEEEYIATMYNI